MKLVANENIPMGMARQLGQDGARLEWIGRAFNALMSSRWPGGIPWPGADRL